MRGREKTDKEVIMSRWTPYLLHSLYSSVWKSAECEEATGKTGNEEENDARLEGEEGEVILESAVETDQVATLEHAQKADEAEWVKGERSLCEGYRCGRLAA